MSKIGIVADPHVTDRHRCRQDNFLETVIRKLDYVAQNNDYVIILGDLFHINNNSNYIFYRMYKLLTKHKGKFIAIPGNHDLMHNNLNMLEKTTIGSLALTSALQLKFNEFEIGKAQFAVSHVMKDLSKISVDGENSKVLIGHNYYGTELCPKETLTREDLVKLNYNLVFLGHDHKPYEEEFIGNSTLIRMGSLTRIDTQEYNRTRKIYYYQLDSETLEYEKIEVPSEEVNKVYTPEAFDKIGRKKDEISFVQIGDVLARFKKKTTGINSLHERLTKIATEKEIDYIRSLHELNNVRYF